MANYPGFENIPNDPRANALLAAELDARVNNGVNANGYGVTVDEFATRIGNSVTGIRITPSGFEIDGAINLKAQLGLGQVNNTQDLNKPISTAQAAVNLALTNIILFNTDVIQATEDNQMLIVGDDQSTTIIGS